MDDSFLRIKPSSLLLIVFVCVMLTCLLLNPAIASAQKQSNYLKYLESLGEYPEDSLATILFQKSQDYVVADSLGFSSQLLALCIDIARQQNDMSLIGLAKITQGKVYNNLLDYRASFLAYNEAYALALQRKDTALLIKAMKGIERYYYQLEMVDSAIIYCVSALAINKLQKNYAELSNNYRSLYTYQRYSTGDVLLNTFVLDGLMDSSLNAAIKSKNPNLLTFVLTGFGLETYNDDIEKAFDYMQKARTLARKLPAPSKELVYALTESSVIYLRSNQTKQAGIFLNEALPLAKKTNFNSQLTHINFLMGDLLYAEDSFSQAVPYYYKAIALAEKYRYRYYLPFIYNKLFEIYLSEKNFDSSYKFQQKYMEVFRKNYNRNMGVQIARLSAKFQVEQKVEAIDDLTIISNQRKTIISNQKRFIVLMGFGIIVIGALFSLLYFQFRKIKKSHLKLSQNALELNQKNREIANLRNRRYLQREGVYNELKIKLEDLFEKKKAYLKKDLTLSKTARLLKTNTSYLSALINKNYHCKFNQFINKYRIQKACTLLSNRKMDFYSIEGIADMSGFKSKSVFNQAFKEATGVHPSAFRKATSAK